MTDWDTDSVVRLGQELSAVGLATDMGYGHLRLDPALCPYLNSHLSPEQRTALQSRWQQAMTGLVDFLYEKRRKDTALAARLTGWELPNLLTLLDHTHQTGDAAATVELCNNLFALLQNLGKPRLLAHIGALRDAAADALGSHWSHAQFEAQRTRVEQLLATGQMQAALDAAQALQQQAQMAGATAYPGADYDMAGACWLLGRVLNYAGVAEQALGWLQQAQQRFEAMDQREPGCSAEYMATVALVGQGDCLRDLGHLDAAADAYQCAIQRHEQHGRTRSVAVGKAQLGTLRLLQRRYSEALAAYQAALDSFAALDEQISVATAWHQIGRIHEETSDYSAAEQAYRQALALHVRQDNSAGLANTLNQLGNLYHRMGRLEDAAAFYRQALNKSLAGGDIAKEGVWRSNLADTLRQQNRRDEARNEIRRAIVCKQPYGHVTEPWKSWGILYDIETADGNASAAAATKTQAMELFLAYRRDGGENHSGSGRLCALVGEALTAGQSDAANAALNQLRLQPDLPKHASALLDALSAICAGRRETALAEHPDLDYDDAAEILLLLENLTLEAAA